MSGDFLTKRGNVWAFQRRTPREFLKFDPRPIYRASTKIKVADDRSGRRAMLVAEKLNRELEAFWNGLAQGISREQLTGYTTAKARARQLGFQYIDHSNFMQQPFEAKLDRIEAWGTSDHVNDPVSRAALFGTAERNAPMVSQVYEEYYSEVREDTLDMSANQLRVWTNSRKRAVRVFLAVIGNDKAITEITHDDALSLREHWRDRVLGEGLVAKTANKEIGQLSAMLKQLSIVHRLKLPDFFRGLKLKGVIDKEPTPYDEAFVQSKMFADGALAGLNEEARLVIYIIADTGLRPSEIVNLNAKTIFLDAPIPYVRVMADGRRLKTGHSDREIPLVGTALPAMKRIMQIGFTRYHDAASVFSATANKYLLENGLRPTLDHTVYSLRHSFKDRLIAAEAQDSLIDSLMGHDSKKPRYGKGPALDLKLKYMSRIAFTPPKELLQLL